MLASTKGAAGLTKDEILGLTSSLSASGGLSQATDDAVLAGANMLATFTQIKGDMFEDATGMILDMATAMNNGAAPSAEQLKGQAIALGKALNDPIKGLGSLSRVGVAFTEEQKGMIEGLTGAKEAFGALATVYRGPVSDSLVKALGDVTDLDTANRALTAHGIELTGEQRRLFDEMMRGNGIVEAQKIIMGELGREFGGSAAASAQTFEGKMATLQERIKGVQQGIGEALMPAAEGLIGFIAGPGMGALEGFANILTGAVGGAVQGAMSLFEQVREPVEAFGSVLVNAFSSGSARLDLLEKLPDWLQPIGRILGDVTGNWGEFFGALQAGSDPLYSFGELVKNNVIDTLANIGVPPDVVGNIQGAMESIGSTIAAVSEGFRTEGLGGAVDALASKFPLLQGPVDTFKTTLASVQETVTAVAAGFQEGGLGGAVDALAAKFPILEGPIRTLGDVLGNVVDAGSQLMGAFGDGGLAGVWERLTSSVSSANPILSTISGVIAGMQPIVEAAAGVWDVISGKFAQFGDMIGPKVQQLWENLQPAFERIGPIFEKLGPVVEGLGTVVGAVLGGVVVTAISIGMGAIEGFISFLPSLGTMFEGVLTVVDGVLGTFGSLIGGVVDTVGALLRGDFTGAWNEAVEAVQGMASGVGTIIEGLWITVSGLFQGGIDLVTGFVSGFTDTITGIFGALSDTLVGHSIIPDMIESIKGVFDAGLNFIKGIWDGAWQWVRDTAISIGAGIASTVSTKVEEVKGFFTAGTAFITGAWDTFWGGISGKATEILVGVVTTVSTKIDEAKGFIAAGTGFIKEGWDTVWGNIGSTLSGAWDGFVTTITTKVGEIQTFLTNFPGQITEGVKTIGAGILGGIQEGITGGWDSFIGWLGGQLGGIVDSAKEFLGIHSPSDEMAKGVGGPISTGVLSGIQESWPAVLAGVQPLLEGLVQAFRDGAGVLTTTWHEGLGAMRTDSIQFANDMWELSRAMFDPAAGGDSLMSQWVMAWEKRRDGSIPTLFKDGLSEMFGQAQNLRNQLEGAIFTNAWFAEMGGRFASAGVWATDWEKSMGQIRTAADETGRAISDGMAAGIEAGRSGVIRAAIDTAVAAYEAAKRALDSSSPSKKFAYLGAMSGAGYSEGLRGQVGDMVSTARQGVGFVLGELSRLTGGAGQDMRLSGITAASAANVATGPRVSSFTEPIASVLRSAETRGATYTQAPSQSPQYATAPAQRVQVELIITDGRGRRYTEQDLRELGITYRTITGNRVLG